MKRVESSYLLYDCTGFLAKLSDEIFVENEHSDKRILNGRANHSRLARHDFRSSIAHRRVEL